MGLKDTIVDGIEGEPEAVSSPQGMFEDDPNALAAYEGALAAAEVPVAPTGFNSQSFMDNRQKMAAELKASEKEAPGFWSTMGAAVENEWVGAALERRGERLQTDTFDPNFKLDKPTLEELAKTHSDREIEYLAASLSPVDYSKRLNDITEDRERDKVIQDSGMSGLGASLAVAMLDPTMIAVGLVTGPLAMSSKAGRVANMLRSGGMVSAESAAATVALTESNTQRQWSDVYVNALAGFAIGGGIGALTRVKAKAANDGTDVVIKKLDEIDEINKDFTDQWSFREAQEVSLKVQGKSLDAVVPEDLVTLYQQKLRVTSSKGVLGEKELGKVNTRIPAIKQQIKDIETLKKSEIANYWAGAGVKRGFQRDIDEARVDAIVSKHEVEISSLQSQLDQLETKQLRHTEAVNAKLELELMQSTTVDQQIKRLLRDSTKVKGISKPTKQYMQDVKVARVTFDRDFDAKYAKAPEPEADSVGAMRADPNYLANRQVYANEVVAEEESDFIQNLYLSTVDHTAANGVNYTRGIPSVMLSDYSNLDASPVLQIRALNQLMNENAQGVANGHSVSVLQHINNLRIRMAGKGAQDRGYSMFLTEQGIGQVKGFVSTSLRNKFDNMVAMGVHGLTPPDQMSPSVKMAVDGFAAQIWEAGRLQRDNGVLGFEKLTQNSNYYPDIMQSEAISDLVYKRGWKPGEVRELIAKGYKEGNNSINDAQANLLSWVKYNNVFNSQLYDGDAKAVFRANSAAEAERLLKDADVPQDLIDAFFTDVLSKDDWATVSSRARDSLHINWSTKMTNANGDTVAISDVMNKNVNQVLEAYTNEAAFNAALGARGIRSEGQLRRIMYQMKRDAYNDTAEFGEQNQELVDAGFKSLENTITQLKGKPLVDYTGKYASVNKLGRAVLDATAISRLQQMGFSSIPELARGITSAGLTEILRAVPGSGALRLPGRFPRDKVSMRHMQEDMAELEEMVGFLGEENMNRTFTIRTDDFGSEANNKFYKTLDNITEGASRVSQWTSGHQFIQGGMEKIVARAVSRRLLKAALGTRNMSKSMKDQVRLAGMSPERWKEISDWSKANRLTTNFNDRPIDTWNYAAMPQDMQKDMQVLMTRLNNRNVQKGLVGETNAMWLGPLGRFITQFKTFSLVSLEKQLIADMRGDKAAMVSNFMWGTGLAYAAYMAQMNLRALGMSESSAEAYLEEQTTGKGLVWGVFNKQSQLAAAGIVSDFGIMTGLAPIEAYDSNRYGYQTGRLDSMVPSIGFANDVFKTLGAGADVGYSVFREDEDVGESFNDFANKAAKIAPFTNTIFFGEYMKNITGMKE